MGLKILVACANGVGTSMIMKMNAEKALKELGLDVTRTHHCAISEARSNSQKFDIIFCPLNFVTMFAQAQQKGVCVIGVKNVLSSEEMKNKLLENGYGK